MMDLYSIQLEVLLVLLGALALVARAVRPGLNPRWLGGALAVAVGGLFLYSFTLSPAAAPAFRGLCRLDPAALFFKRLLLGGTVIALVVAMEFPALRSAAVECFALMLFAAAGMLLLASVNDFVLLFVALELVTICFFAMTSLLRKDPAGLEAGMKYLIMGALSASLTIYGIAYIYGATGQTQFDGVRMAMSNGAAAAYRFGFLLVLIGIGFKAAMVPLQVWAPDVYQGGPTPAVAFLASGSKVAGFVLLLRLAAAGLVPAEGGWLILLVWLAGITLLYGTLGALGQTDLKRLLGYSSIAHAGYLLMGLAVGTPVGRTAMSCYLAQYMFTVLAAFLVVSVIGTAAGSTDGRGLAGLHRRSPFAAFALFLAMMSLAGVPPLSGAVAKFLVLLEVMRLGASNGAYYVLAGVGAASVVISLAFYFSVLRAALLAPDNGAARIELSVPTRLALTVCVIVMIGLGVWPAPLLQAASGLLP